MNHLQLHTTSEVGTNDQAAQEQYLRLLHAEIEEQLAYYRAQPDLLEQLENATPEEAKRLLEEFHWAETHDPYAAVEEAERQFLAEQKEREEESLLAYGR